jgi:YesN/AraC family two-component response regulator
MKLIDEVRPELEERLLKCLISGTEYTEEELQEKLHSMCSTQIADYKYQVILAYPVTLQNEEDDVMHQIVLHQLKEYLNTLEMDSETTMFMISEVKSYSAVILRYPKSDDRGISASPASYILEVIKKFSSTQAIHIMISEGKIVDSLKDLRLSYENAEDKITYQIYLSDESGDSGLTSDYGNHKEFEEKLESLKDSLKRYELASADKFVQTILKEIAQSNSEVDEKKHQYTLILDLLAERALMLGSDNQSDKRKRLGSVYTKLKNDNARKTIDKSVLDAAHELLQLIKEASLRKQSRLVIGAKECVEKYYGSIDLSMNRIAEELGISASYLSTIFAEYTGMNLVGYLSTYRVKMAQDLLIHTNIKIRDVGYKTGFNTVQNFNRVFKRYVGITPGEYRSKYQTAKDFI